MRKIKTGVLIMALILTFTAVAFASSGEKTATPSQTKFIMDGKEISFDVTYNIEDSNYIQLRSVAQTLNGTKSQFNVYWDDALKQAVIETGVPYTGVKPTTVPTQAVTEPVFKNATELNNYLKTTYPVVQTSLGSVPLEYSVLFNNTSMSAYDYKIMVKYDDIKVFDYLYDKSITQAKIDTFKQEMKDYMLVLATDIISKMPGQKLNGEYYYSYYKYPNIKQDLVYYIDNEWTNFGVIDWLKSSYSNYTASDKLTWIDNDEDHSYFRNVLLEIEEKYN